MSETKHTPGPWKIDGGVGSKSGDYFIWRAGEYFGGHGLAQVFKEGALSHGGSVQANARLIAAAPDLLEALKLCFYTLKALGGSTADERKAAILKARAAIRKAEGEA